MDGDTSHLHRVVSRMDTAVPGVAFSARALSIRVLPEPVVPTHRIMIFYLTYLKNKNKTPVDRKGKLVDRKGHKVLTYIEYRTVSGDFRAIDPHPLYTQGVSTPRTKGGGCTTGGEGMWGQ